MHLFTSVCYSTVGSMAVVEGSGSDVLGTVRHRAAAHAENEIDFLLADEVDRAIERFQGRIRLDAGKFNHLAPGQRRADLGMNAVFLY